MMNKVAYIKKNADKLSKTITKTIIITKISLVGTRKSVCSYLSSCELRHSNTMNCEPLQIILVFILVLVRENVVVQFTQGD